jgi:hypothetical protein
MFGGGLVLGVHGFALLAVEFALFIKRGRMPPERREVCLQLGEVSGVLASVESVGFQLLEFYFELRVFALEFLVFGVETPCSFLRSHLRLPDH